VGLAAVGAARVPRGRRAAVAAVLLSPVAALGGLLPAHADGSVASRCAYPDGVTANTWTPLPGGMAAVDQLDGDACRLVGVTRGVDGVGRAWRSSDAGQSWSPVPSAPNLSGVVAERLSRRAGSTWIGPVLASGPVGVPVGSAHAYLDASSQVYASGDSGAHFTPSTERVNGADVPLAAHILSAATSVRYVAGRPRPEVYVVAAAVRSPAVASLPAASADRQLLVSRDGAASFEPVPTAAPLDPTAVEVNPTNPDEIWVNSLRASAPGGGAWVSRDAGTTWISVCCATATVHDIAFGPGVGGQPEVLLATDMGLRVSDDDGASWTTVDSTPVVQARAAPDNAHVVVALTSDGRVLLWRPLGSVPTTTPGLPAGCAPTQLRRTEVVPATLLVTCTSDGSTYRLLLDDYASDGSPTGPKQPGGPGVPGWPGVPASTLTAVPLHELGSWKLPSANLTSGAIAFDGTNLYYDSWAGLIGVMRAADGRSLGNLPIRLPAAPVGLTVDMKRNRLLITATDDHLYAYGLASHRLVRLAQAPYAVPSFDASTGGLSWVPTTHTELQRDTLTGGPYNIETVCSNIPTFSVAGGDSDPSSFVADGGGGGYVQAEDDQTLYRIDAACHLVGPLYQHRKYSEARDENDAMACDAQTFFPQSAIWIRDSAPGTVTAYGVPYGHCPMPSRLTIAAPATLAPAAVTNVCTTLTNATTGQVMPGRGVSLSVQGLLLGNQVTDVAGTACFGYVAPVLRSGRMPLQIRATFGGDVSLYPSSAVGRAAVLAALPAVIAPLVHPPALPVAPPPPQAPPPNAPNAPAQAPGSATNISQAQQGQAQAQSQPVMQAVAVPQQEHQPQLALATVANQLETNTAGQNAMTAPLPRPQRQSGWPSPLLLVAGAVSCGLVTALARGRLQVSTASSRPRKAVK
jgi:hypothetical protein